MGITVAGMFYRVNDFGYPRSEKQAIGFYLFHCFVVLVGMLLALMIYSAVFGLDALTATTENVEKASLMRNTVQVFSVFYVAHLTYQVLAAKRRLGSALPVLAGLAGIGLALFGLLWGMIIVSALSILRPNPVESKGEY